MNEVSPSVANLSMNGVKPFCTGWFRAADYLLKTEMTGSRVKISLTNSRLLWHNSLHTDELINLAKSQNAAMEASNDRFLSAALELLNTEQKKLECKPADNMAKVTCSFKTSLQDFSFSLIVELAQANVEEYYKEITLSLLASIHQVQTEREELMKIIQAKDAEIGEYKLAGATLFRKSVATKYFNKAEFLKNSITKALAGDNPFQADDVCRDVLTSFNQIRLKFEEKVENKETTVKTEPHPSSSELAVSNLSTKQQDLRPESPVLNLPKRPRTGKLAKLI